MRRRREGGFAVSENGIDPNSEEATATLAALHRVYLETLPEEEHTHDRAVAARASNELPLLDALDVLARTKVLDPLQKWHVIASALTRTSRFDTDVEVLNRMGRVITADIEKDPPSDEEMADRLTDFVTKRRPPDRPPDSAARGRPASRAKTSAARTRASAPAESTTKPKRTGRGTTPRSNGRG
jgi:hypothetical protein